MWLQCQSQISLLLLDMFIKMEPCDYCDDLLWKLQLTVILIVG